MEELLQALLLSHQAALEPFFLWISYYTLTIFTRRCHLLNSVLGLEPILDEEPFDYFD